MVSPSVPYPTNSVWGIIDSPGEGEDARAETLAALPEDRVRIYRGAADAEMLRHSLRRHGILSRIMFYGAGSEEEDLKRYAIAAGGGACVVRVDLRDRNEHDQVSVILR